MGTLERARGVHPARVRPCGRARGRAATARSAGRGRDRRDARRARRGSSSRAGGDLDPETYGADAHPETNEVSRERDSAELALLQAALGRDMPVLAVCRGSQVLNVARGGDLVQHLPEIVGHDRHRHEEGVMADHEVRVEAGSRLGVDPRRQRAREVVAPPGLRADRRRSARERLGRGRHDRGGRGSVAPLRARRALAPRRGRGLRALRGPGRGGRGRTAASRES